MSGQANLGGRAASRSAGEPIARADLAAEAMRLRAQGLLHREIAERMEISISYACDLVNDPDRKKQLERRAGYGRPCRICGRRTTGSEGRVKAPDICAKCRVVESLAPCGTRSAYDRGCSCDECRAAMRRYMASLKGKKPPRHGTVSAYKNYGCRCDKCRRANSRNNFLLADERKRYPSVANRKAA